MSASPAASGLLKVGELSRRTGVTVRALHHYDSLGLLRPSGRSESGYRLYNRDDVARLHAIQSLRRMGVPLAEVARLLDGQAGSLQAVLAQQIQALDQEIERARTLRERLGLMQLVLAGGGQPALDDWLASLATMHTLERYFSADELKRAFDGLARCAEAWPPLVREIRALMDRGVAPGDIALQPLLQRWIDLASRWMDGDLGLLERWGRMLREQPDLPLQGGIDRTLLDYVDEGLRLRQAVIARHVGEPLLPRLRATRPQWQALVARGLRLMGDGVPVDAPAARELAREWQALMHQTVGADEALRERLLAAYEHDPMLRAGLPLTPALRHYIEQATTA
jgi:DNA-binding transcriptional MerR regulator